MSRLDGKSEVSVASTLLPAVYEAVASGTSVDLAGFDAATVIITAGAITSSDGTPSFPFEVQHAPDSAGSPGSWGPVPDAELIGAEPTIVAANDEAVHVVGYTGINRWLRVSIVATVGGTNPELPAAAVVVRQKGRKQQ